MTTGTLINKLFTVNSLKKIITNQNIEVYKRTVDTISSDKDDINTNLDAVVKIYKYMSKKHRNEYYYKNTLVNKILLGRHSVKTSTAIRELPILDNILDLLIVNGIGQVYEIKTGLDNLDRLSDQLDAYYKAFSYCNVVTDISHLQALREMLEDTPTGIILLTDRGTLHVDKKAEKYEDKLSGRVIFNILRKYEFENIINKEFGSLPETTQSKYYGECFKIFQKIDINQAQSYMLKELKKRNSVNADTYSQFKEIPREIKSLVYFSDYNLAEYNLLNEFLESKY